MSKRQIAGTQYLQNYTPRHKKPKRATPKEVKNSTTFDITRFFTTFEHRIYFI